MKSEQSILVIDDEAIVCESFKRILSNKGYKVDSKTEPYEGLEMALSNKYDLVFLDLKMDKLDGMDLFNELRKKDPDMPVAVVTGYPTMDTAIESVKLHASDYILKPFTPEEILKSVNRIMPQKDISDTAVEHVPEKPAGWKPSYEPIQFNRIAWIQQGKDGSVRVGGQLPNFISCKIDGLQLPNVNETTNAGLPLAGVVLNNKSRIIIPSPLSGKIIEVNKKLAVNPSVIKANSFADSWIARIEPVDIEKDLRAARMRNVTLLCKSLDDVTGYLPGLVNLGCIVYCADTVQKAVRALIKEKNNIIFIDAASLSDNGPECVKAINREIPDAKVVIIGKPDSELEETFRKDKILYYCVSSLFDKEITDILYSIFTSVQDDDVYEYCPISVIPQSIRRVHITNKRGKKVALLVFGDLLYNNKDIGYLLIDKLVEKSFPINVARGINNFHPDDSDGQQLIEKNKEKNDIVITLQAKDSNRLPGQIQKDVEEYTNKDGSDSRMIKLVVQPKIIDGKEHMIFNSMTTEAIAGLLLDAMT